jgi:hypothetical protein
MIKKMMLLALSVGALVAFAAPAIASANTGQLTGAGETLVGTSTNTKTVTAAGTLVCSHVELEGEVQENGASGSMLGNGVGFTEGCEVEQNHAPVTITDPTVTTLTLNSSGGSATLTFISDIAGVLVCHFSGTVPVTWTAPSNTIHIAGTLTGTGAGCPTAGSISGDFALSSGGEEVIVD